MWTKKPPSEEGFYLWRIPDDRWPYTIDPFMVFIERTSGIKFVQELSRARQHSPSGLWSLDEWIAPSGTWPEDPSHTEYLWLGKDIPHDTVIALRDLYHAAMKAYRNLTWTPDLSEYGKSVASDLLAAINSIHNKETE